LWVAASVDRALASRAVLPTAFYVGLAFLAGERFVFGCGTSGADVFFSDSVVVFIGLS
jgi:hypothetical protein